MTDTKRFAGRTWNFHQCYPYKSEAQRVASDRRASGELARVIENRKRQFRWEVWVANPFQPSSTKRRASIGQKRPFPTHIWAWSQRKRGPQDPVKYKVHQTRSGKPFKRFIIRNGKRMYLTRSKEEDHLWAKTRTELLSKTYPESAPMFRNWKT